MNVAVFGGSFDPPHVGHVLACTLLLSIEEIDQVVVVPAHQHAFGKPLAPFDDRLTMCGLAMGWMARVAVLPIEREIGGESRSVRTLERLAAEHPEWRMRLVVGADILPETSKWQSFDAVCRLAPPLILGRAGYAEEGPRLLPEVSSTQVRAAIARRDWSAVEPLVPRSVLAFVRRRGLYRTA